MRVERLRRWARGFRRRIRRYRRERLAPLAGRLEWPLVGLAALVAVGLGYDGFRRYFQWIGETRRPDHLLYLSAQLFITESGAVPGPIPWQLQAARFLAPLVPAYAAIKAVTHLFRDQLRQLGLMLRRRPVVICGAGRKGALLAEAFRDRGRAVVVVEIDEEAPDLADCRHAGAVIVTGDATEPWVLKRARIGRASHLLCMCGDDGVNAEIAAEARSLSQARDEPLSCVVHVFDPELWNLLQESWFTTVEDPRFRIEFFNVFQRGAQALLDDHPAFDPEASIAERCPHLLVLGLGKFGQSLVVDAARRWRATRLRAQGPLPVTVVDRAATARCDALAERWPRLRETCRLTPCDTEVGSAEFERGEYLSSGPDPVSAVYVCFDDEPLALSSALELRGPRLGLRDVPIVVRLAKGGGLATLIGDDGQDGVASHAASGPASGRLVGFPVIERTCTPELVTSGMLESLARAVHEGYVRWCESEGETPETKPNMVEWKELPEDLKEANRAHAMRARSLLQAEGYAIRPDRDWVAEPARLPDHVVERMARAEHEHWMREREETGWSHGARKDERAKTTPHLVPWERLDEQTRDIDRAMVRNLPAILAEFGFTLERMKKPK